jgi:ABC-type polysaccharide/polyol phosphate export permease
MMNNFYAALREIKGTLDALPLVGVLGWQDIRGRYRRSSIGPFWLTISMGVMIASIGLVFGQIFNTPMREYLPFLTAGTILWAFITGTINEGCTGFIDAQGIIKQLPIPLFVHILRVLWRNLLILGHNILILPLVLLATGKGLSYIALIAIPGLVLMAISLSWITLLLALICARYRDMPQVVTSVMQVVFYLTPIIWTPSSMPSRTGVGLLDLNPFFHLLELVRGPLLGQMPSATNWGVIVFSSIFGWIFALFVFSRLRNRVAYWV